MLSRRLLTALLPALLLSVIPGGAQARASFHAITFRDIEFDYPKDERLTVARTRFGAELPIGTPIPQAEVVLRKADARCRHYIPGNGLSCRFDMTDAPYNHLHDIEWTVRVAEASGRLTALAIDRQSYGS